MEKTSPSFYKIMFDWKNNDELRIPPSFLKYLPDKDCDEAILKRHGRRWNIKVYRNRDDIFFREGWKQFLEDHALGDNEFLTFLYEGNMCFEVQIFEPSGVERLEVTKQMKTLQQSNFTHAQKQRRPASPPKMATGSGTCRSQPQSEPKNKDNGKKVKMEPEEPVEDMETAGMREEKNETRKLPTECNSSDARYYYFSQKDHSEGRSKNWEMADSFASTNPYFVSCLYNSAVKKVFLLRIPASFAAKHFPQWKTSVILRNVEGKSWEVNYIHNKNNRVFSGGWSAFVIDNKLKKGDICIFELVAGCEMLVHIYSA